MAKQTGSLNVRIDTQILESLRNVVYWKHGITLNMYVEQAIQEALSKEENIKERPGELRRGIQIR